MSEGANKAFKSQREQFLTQHMIVMRNPQQFLSAQGVNLQAPTGPLVLDFDLVYDPATKFVDANGVNVKVYTLALMEIRKGYTLANDANNVLTATRNNPKKGVSTHAIRAYYLPWDNNRHYESQLGNAADYMFTPTMDGCSFVIGSGTSPKVSHLNYQNNESRIDQKRIDKKIAKVFGDDAQAATRLTLADYSPNSHKEKLEGKLSMLTVVGFRDKTHNTWSFYYQKRTQTMTTLGIQQILTDRLVPIQGGV